MAAFRERETLLIEKTAQEVIKRRRKKKTNRTVNNLPLTTGFQENN